MEITYPYAAGLDVHKKTVVACCLTPGPNGKLQHDDADPARTLLLWDDVCHHPQRREE